jgi:hypothetical protein
MKDKNKNAKGTEQRTGDTSRTSNQGRKLASGGRSNDRRNAEMDEDTNSPRSETRKNGNRTNR